ncbi:MAG: GNAT family N-acetyltransferase [Cyanobacteriota bacterium]|nr:GNAT family N-acetyltransferase [Cyanobacteriota bacterium]
MNVNVRSLDLMDELKACQVLVEAFREDPVVAYLTSESSRDPILRCVMSGILRYCQPYRHLYGAYTPDGSLVGVAGWMPPHTPLEDLRGWLRVGFYHLPRLVPVKLWGRWFHFATLIKPSPQPFWSLQILAVHPDYQGQGIGKKLLKPILKLSEQQGIPCCLETSTLAAMRFYQRQGFAQTVRLHLNDEELSYWQMERSPQFKDSHFQFSPIS